MRTLKEGLKTEYGSKQADEWAFKYQTSYFVTFSSGFKKWHIKNIKMTINDQTRIIEDLNNQVDKYVEGYKTEDRDPDFIYNYEVKGLIEASKDISEAFEVFEQQDNSKLNSDSDEEQTHEFFINNYGNGYPPNDEVQLIVHEFLLNGQPILIFCQQLRTTLSRTSLKMIINNSLQEFDKDGLYKINNQISFLLTPQNYFVININYFEKLFSFDNQISLKKEKALDSIRTSGVIEGFEEIENILKKGYMTRSLAKITLEHHEIQDFLKNNHERIRRYCQSYQVGATFDSKTNKLIVTDKEVAPLFITYLFSERVAENIIGELVYYKTYNRLNKV